MNTNHWQSEALASKLFVSLFYLNVHECVCFVFFQEKAQKETLAIGCLSQLVSPQSPAMLIVVQENQSPDGHYGFTCRRRDGGGLVVVKVDNSQLCVHDR